MNRLINLAFCFLPFLVTSFAQDAPKPEDYYKVVPIPVPEGIVLEAGGLDFMPDGRLAVSTRRGDIYMVSNALDDVADNETFSLWARGLHEVLGPRLRGRMAICDPKTRDHQNQGYR